ncbi:DNA replication ATP-dependent helicase [Arachis hypogaea]|nr:DNA replication ATP-dependent helicase [Arachis hypogaea]
MLFFVSTTGSALEHIKRTHEAINEKESKHISAAVSLISNEQHGMEINSACIAAEEDVAKNSKDLFEQFDDSRQQKNVLGSSRKLGQTGQSSNSNDVKVGNKKHAPMKKQTLVSIQPQDTSVECLIWKVAGSFGCLRRTVLDERLKCNEYSTAALTGTLLHQIFQVGLTEDNPTIDFLEGYIEVVLLRNIESLYACGDKRMEMLVPVESLLSYCFDPILLTPFHGKLYVGNHRCQWLHPILSVKMVQMLCHSTANHLAVLNQVGVESNDSFASVTNAQPSGV